MAKVIKMKAPHNLSLKQLTGLLNIYELKAFYAMKEKSSTMRNFS